MLPGTTADSPQKSASTWSGLTPGRFALLLAALVAVSFPSVLFGARTFVVRDFGMFGFPLAYFHRESFWRGEMPFWNPLNSCGLPFMAQWNTLTLYPPSLIYLLLPLTWSLPFFCLLHLFWGGLGMYFWAYRCTNHRFAAALAGIIYAFNGLSLNALMWPNIEAALGWLPWVVWLGQKGWQEGGRTLVLAVLAAAMQLLTGGPEPILLTWVLLAVLAAGDFMSGAVARGTVALRFLALGLLVGLVCAAQMLPFLELLAHSQRDRGFSSASHDWAMPIWGWANFLVPLFRTTRTAQGVFLQIGQYWTSSYYTGIATLLLALVAVRRTRDWRALLIGALLLLGLVLALGNGTLLYQALLATVPGMGFIRYPIKYVVLVLAVAPLLAALGLRTLEDRKTGVARFECIMGFSLLALTGLVLVVDWRTASHDAVWRATLENGIARAGAFILIVAAGCLCLRASGRKRAYLGAFFLGLVWLDLVLQVPNQNPTTSHSVYAPGWANRELKLQPQPALGQARVMLGADVLERLRFYGLPDPGQNFLRNRLAIRPDANLLDGLAQIDGFYSMTPREAAVVTQLPYQKPERAYSALLDFMAVSFTTVSNQIEWAQRPSAMPVVTVGQQPIFTTDLAALDAISNTNFDFRQQVLLPPEAGGSISAVRQEASFVRVKSVAHERIEVQTEAAAPSMVVISQTSYPAWKAFVDGKPARLWRANYAFQAVEVPAGNHTLLLKYEDKMFFAGLGISACGLLACIVLWLREGRVKNPLPS